MLGRLFPALKNAAAKTLKSQLLNSLPQRSIAASVNSTSRISQGLKKDTVLLNLPAKNIAKKSAPVIPNTSAQVSETELFTLAADQINDLGIYFLDGDGFDNLAWKFEKISQLFLHHDLHTKENITRLFEILKNRAESGKIGETEKIANAFETLLPMLEQRRELDSVEELLNEKPNELLEKLRRLISENTATERAEYTRSLRL